MHLTISEIARACDGEVLCGEPTLVAHGVSWDSRSIAPGALYAALPGARVDGHDYCLEAVRSGAVAVLISREPGPQMFSALLDAGAAAIRVDDVQAALSALAGQWRRRLTGQVIALTGSSGKTTTKNLVRDVLSAAGSVVATVANQNNELGVPATLLAASEDTDYVVVEMGMRGLGQLAELCAFVRPTCALVTNVGTSHMELLGSREAIARAKAEPLAFLPEDGVAFLNVSDPYSTSLLSFGGVEERGIEVYYFDGSGVLPQAYGGRLPQAYASDISFDKLGNPHFMLHVPGSSTECSLQLAGQHNIHNAVAAAAVGAHFGMNAADIAAALAAAQPVAGRSVLLNAASGASIVDDSYNANPDSMCASLAAFHNMQVNGRRIAVLGDMGELGSYSLEGHELAGRAAAAAGLDALICVGSLSRDMARAACEAGMDQAAVSCVDSSQKALDALATMEPALGASDAILIKASHATGLDAVVKGLVK